MFTWDLVDPVQIGSAIWFQMGPLVKVILYGTEPFQFRTGPGSIVDPIPNGSKHVRSRVNVASRLRLLSIVVRTWFYTAWSIDFSTTVTIQSDCLISVNHFHC